MNYSTFNPPQLRYGHPPADAILHNRFYTVGYSYLFKQPKWVIEIIDLNSEKVVTQRRDAFRPDYRIPEPFRVKDTDYEGSGYARGHLIASANKLSSEVANSETFLMTNMSPQVSSFNSGVWSALEERVRELRATRNLAEVYVASGPLFAIGLETNVLQAGLDNERIIPIPHFFFKSILSESKRGAFKFYGFIIPNIENDQLNELNSYQVPTIDIERFSGLPLWSGLQGRLVERRKRQTPTLWF